MPPRRAPQPKPRKKATSKDASDLDISAEEEAEIREAWEIFLHEELSEKAGEEVIQTGDVRRVLIALGVEPSREELKDILETVDPEGEGFVTYPALLQVAVLKLQYRDTEKELIEAFHLFTDGYDRPIRLDDLRRVAGKIKADVTDEQLRDMLMEACTKEIGMGVDLKDFETVMRKAGVL
ncbi:hypothetical protein RUND412_010500 [Rhizina undulata]